jgi:hypothetical protein
MLYRSGDVCLDEIRFRLFHVRHVVEVVSPLCDACGATEVVDRRGGVATFGKAERELFVEPIEAADIGEDHDTGSGGLLRQRAEGGELIPIRGTQHEIVVRDRRA